MNLLDVDLANEPIDVEEFSYAQDSDYPICLVGFQIKNLYDQKRLKINKKFKTKNIIHFVPNKSITPKFFKGIEINVSNKYISLVERLNLLGHNNTSIALDTYKQILKEYNLGCNNCYAHLCDGVYPIDSEYISKFSNLKLTTDDMYEKILDTNDTGFQSFGYFVIYILSNKNYSKTSTNFFIKNAVKMYNSL
jgi:hypothetical protein